MKTTFLKSMFKAGKLVRGGSLIKATDVIQKAMVGLGNPLSATTKTPYRSRPMPTPIRPTAERAPASEPIVRPIFEKRVRGDDATEKRGPPGPTPGAFHARSFGGAGQEGHYKVFVPATNDGEPMALVVMLHGCTQSPDDFAAGTEMNSRAAEQGFVVLYPAQSRAANPSGCWNWFRRQDQVRGNGEPALIAGITLAVIAEFGVDPKRVAIAGLSAGGAMAAIVAHEYPEMFSAVGIHSGLPAGAATNLPDALAIMRTGVERKRGSNLQASRPAAFVPTIVFHGDADHTVHPDNGARAVDAAMRTSGFAVTPVRAEGTSTAGRPYSRTTYASSLGKTAVEHWVVSGGAHAWSGGSHHGTYTDPKGPSATDEMLRFFNQSQADA